jgi:hypothetical protein
MENLEVIERYKGLATIPTPCAPSFLFAVDREEKLRPSQDVKNPLPDVEDFARIEVSKSYDIYRINKDQLQSLETYRKNLDRIWLDMNNGRNQNGTQHLRQRLMDESMMIMRFIKKHT